MRGNDLLESGFKGGNIVIKDGGMGTEILRRGQKTTLPLWSAEVLMTNPNIVKKIHKDYIDAGAQIITTNTFRTTERTLAKKNIHGKAGELTRLACLLARQAIEEAKPKREVLIAGSVAPLEECYSPELTPKDEELQREHFSYVRDLKEGGVDFILAETMITLRELHYVMEATKKLDMPLAVSFCMNEKLQLLGGEELGKAVAHAEKYEPLFVGINCVSLEVAFKCVKSLRSVTNLPICVYAQGDGSPNDDQGWGFNKGEKLDLYLNSARKWAEDGATIIGGCCGTTPLYIRELRSIFRL